MAVDCCAVLWFVAAANKMTSCGGESASGHKAGGCGGKRSCVEFCGQTAHAQHHTLRVDACNTSVQNTKHTCTCGTMLDSRTGVFCVGVGMIYVHSRLLGACGCCLAGSARIAVSPAVGVTSTLSILFYSICMPRRGSTVPDSKCDGNSGEKKGRGHGRGNGSGNGDDTDTLCMCTS